MISRIKFLTPILTLPLLTTPSAAQKLKKADKVVLSSLEVHVRYLSDDRLEGRRTGTPGEKTASDYITSEFGKIGLKPKGDGSGWLQSFDIDEGRVVSDDAFFTVNDHPFLLNREYFPLAISASGSVTGSPAIALQESGVPWFLDLRELLESGAGNPHFDLRGAIRTRAAACAKKGATALLLYNSSKTADNLTYDPAERAEPATIPILYITREAKRKYLKDEAASLDIKLKIGFTQKKRTGHNIIGILDNGAQTTVVIGAHYDHLGHGEDSNTLYRGNDPTVTFSGAGDNASGVAALIELARSLSLSRLKTNNYLFVAFSGEEQGQRGSGYLAAHLPVNAANLNYMLNLEMIGRLNESSHALAVSGYGSSPAWWGICREVKDQRGLFLVLDSSGVHPGDQAPFYKKGIPVLSFSTGPYPEYHLPGDSPDKINYPGELEVLKFIYEIVEGADKRGRLSFAGRKE
jgi:aminopeptidase YwaD